MDTALGRSRRGIATAPVRFKAFASVRFCGVNAALLAVFLACLRLKPLLSASLDPGGDRVIFCPSSEVEKSMVATSPTLLVAANEKVALVKISGRASFNSSVEFKRLVYGLREEGHRRFVLDLTDCLILDSTFLGVLAGFALKLTEVSGEQASITLLNPNERILDLLDNLGVSHLFKVIQGQDPLSETCAEVPASADSPTRTETSRACLEAHETLMAINPANIPKFKDVTKFMAEDLKKQEARKT